MALVNEIILSSNTGLDAIRRAPIVEENTGIHCLRIQDITNKKSICNWGYTSCTDKDFSTHQLKKNDIIMARTCSVGVNFFVEKDLPAVYNNGLARIRVNESICIPKFLYYVFKTDNFKGYMYGVSAGTSVQANIKLKDILQYKFWLPDYDCQSKIVTILDSIENKIENNNAINRNLSMQLRVVFEEMFITNVGEQWPEKKLGDFLELERGLSYKGKFLAENEGIPMLNLGNILPNSVFRPEKLKYYIGEYKQRHTVRPGDIIVANTDLTQAREVLGSAIRVPDLGYEEVICSHHISIVRNSKISNNFILGLLNMPAYRTRVAGFATGTTVLALPNETILNCEFLCPPDELFTKYDEIATPIYGRMEELRRENDQLALLRDTILPKLMSGELDVSDLDI